MKSTAQLITATTLLSLSIMLGCQLGRSNFTVQVPTAESPQDEALSNRVRTRLVADKKVDLSNVRVVSSEGTVYLSGIVKTLDARQQAIKIAWQAPGVKAVVNSLEVENS